jgi:hypothetical protein
MSFRIRRPFRTLLIVALACGAGFAAWTPLLAAVRPPKLQYTIST